MQSKILEVGDILDFLEKIKINNKKIKNLLFIKII